KGAWRVTRHEDIVPTIFEAYRTAVSGFPGPVLVEIPVDVQLFRQQVTSVPAFEPLQPAPLQDPSQIQKAAELLLAAKNPGIFVGWGAVDVSEQVQRIADLLGAPVSTTLQGLSAFPADHPMHTGMG